MGARVTGLGHVGIFVNDIPMMIDFYTNVLGMTLTDRGTERQRRVPELPPERGAPRVRAGAGGRRAEDDTRSRSRFTVGSLDGPDGRCTARSSRRAAASTGW